MNGTVMLRLARISGLALVVLASTGCFASLAQLDEVNEAVNVTRAEAAASDSVRATQLVQILATLRALNDSVGALNLRLTRLRAETQAETRSMRQEVNQMLEVTGQSERRMRELREQMDRRAAAAAANPPAGDTTGRSSSPPAAAEPGPSELIELGRDQLLRGANSSARAVFTDFLTRYPDSELAVDAHFYIAEAHAAEGSTAAADSAYSRVVARFPASARAPTALYKRGVMAQTAGRRTAARRLFNELISEYPSSDEADLARERLRVMN